MYPPARRVLCLAVAAFASAGCVHIGRQGWSVSFPVPASVFADSRTIDISVPKRPGMLTLAQFKAIASSVRTLRADPTELSLDVGDTIRVADQVRIVALDSLGAVLGELPYYDLSYEGRGYRLLADGRVHINRKGTVMFTALLPAQLWHGRASKRPSVRVPLVVHEGS